MFGVEDGAVERVRAVAGVRALNVEDRDQAQVLVIQTDERDVTSAVLTQLAGAQVGRVSARADARGRLRAARLGGVVRSARLLFFGWFLQLKLMMRSAWNSVLGVVWPMFFATTAFFIFRAGHDPHTLLFASLGASVMGIWSATSTSAASMLQRERRTGTLELLAATPANFALVLLPISVAMATVGLYSMVATLLWGHFVFGIAMHLVHPLLFVVAVPVTIASVGALGFLLAVAFVRYRPAWALGNALEYPCG